MPLQTLQRDFQAALTAGAPGFMTRVVDTPPAGSAQRLDIYAQAYRLRLLDTLEGDFAKLATLLGDAQFESLGLAYIASHPPHHPSLRWLGRNMAGFLGATPPWSDQPVLADMAAFEWAQGEVFDAPDAAAVSPGDIAALPPARWATLRLQAHPAVRRLDLRWNVPAIWQALDIDTEPPAPAHSDHPQGWLLWRRELDIHWRSLGVEEAWAVDAWRSGANFAELCEGLCEWTDAARVATHAASLLKGWLSEGLVTAILTD
jgi:hypothetical protein